METKALKKQLGAAIAMVIVAAVALGSATYAWFATNNTVKASTTTISAKSNAAFLTISNDTTGNATAKAVNTTTAEKTVTEAALYPATFTLAKSSEDAAAPASNQWQTGYASSVEASAINSDGLKACKTAKEGDSSADGTTAAAINGDFILAQDYTISSRGTNQTNLKAESVSVKTDTTESTSSLKTALRIMVTCGDITAENSDASWVVYGWDDTESKFVIKESSSKSGNSDTVSYTNPVLADTVTAEQDTTVHVYLYYEGSDTNVYTKNLQENKLTATNAVTVTFTATPDNK